MAASELFLKEDEELGETLNVDRRDSRAGQEKKCFTDKFLLWQWGQEGRERMNEFNK